MLSVGVLLASVAVAETGSGPRIPMAYFTTTGTGQSDDGIPPDPYETFSYDLALDAASIKDFNVVYYTSVLPPESYEVPLTDKLKSYFHHGAVLETIMAKAGGVNGDTAVAGVGRVWAVDAGGKPVGGYAAEYEYVYNSEIDDATARKNAQAQLDKSLDHILQIRGLKQTGEREYDIAVTYITKNYGMALAAICFLNFTYPDPIPVQE
jgi:arginine decarboxylase